MTKFYCILNLFSYLNKKIDFKCYKINFCSQAITTEISPRTESQIKCHVYQAKKQKQTIFSCFFTKVKKKKLWSRPSIAGLHLRNIKFDMD